MSTDKEKLNELVGKVDEILTMLNKISQDLRTVSASMKSIAVGQITQPPAAQAPAAPAAVAPPSVAGSKQRSLDDIRMSFPEELEARLSFEEKATT